MQGVQFGYALPIFLNRRQVGRTASQNSAVRSSSQSGDSVQFGNAVSSREQNLKNGGTAYEGAIVSVMAQIEDLRLRDEVDPLIALVDKCRPKNYNEIEIENDRDRNLLIRWGLLNSDGSVDPTTRDIVVSAAKGEGLDLVFVDPIQRSGT